MLNDGEVDGTSRVGALHVLALPVVLMLLAAALLFMRHAMCPLDESLSNIDGFRGGKDSTVEINSSTSLLLPSLLTSSSLSD